MTRKKYYYRPYNIDIKYEQKTYNHVGMDYGNRKVANLGFSGNIFRWIRKIVNRDQKYYKFCDTYSDWENHIKERIPSKECDKKDFLHWLKLKKSCAESYCEAVKIIIIPCYIAIVSMFELLLPETSDQRTVALILLLLTVAIPSIIILQKSLDEVNFFEDLITLVETM